MWAKVKGLKTIWIHPSQGMMRAFFFPPDPTSFVKYYFYTVHSVLHLMWVTSTIFNPGSLQTILGWLFVLRHVMTAELVDIFSLMFPQIFPQLPRGVAMYPVWGLLCVFQWRRTAESIKVMHYAWCAMNLPAGRCQEIVLLPI